MPHMKTMTRVAMLAGTIAVAATGCYATVDPQPQPVGYAEVTSAPVDIETYPSVVYGGQPTYFYGDHWWHRDGGGHYVSYSSEPAELHRQRAYVQRAPRRAAPAAHEEGRIEAPPAERGR